MIFININNSSKRSATKWHFFSVHTTINGLEGLAEPLEHEPCSRRNEVQLAIKQGIQVLLDRQLIFQKQTLIPLHPSMAEHHYPIRWK